MANYTPIEILVADDNPEDVLLLSLAFRRARINHSLVRVANGKEAVDYLRAKSLPDMVLLDLNMPGMDGFQVLEWVRGQPALQKLPVIVLSSSTLEKDRVRAKELGATDYFVKDEGLESLLKGLSSRFSQVVSEVA